MNENNQDSNISKEFYSNVKGTGPLATLAFTIASIVIMYVISVITG